MKAARVSSLTARAAHIKCTIDFISASIDAFTTNAPNAPGVSDLAAQKAKLQNDYSQISAFVPAGDYKSFDSAWKNTVNPDIRAARDAVEGVKRNAFSKPAASPRASPAPTPVTTKDQREAVRTAIKTARDAFATCQKSSAIQEAQARVAWYQIWVNRWNQIIQQFSAKGLDTGAMQAAVQEEQQAITALQAAITSGDAAQVRSAMKDLNNKHYHAAANFAIARLNSILTKISAAATAAGYGSQVQTIQSQLQTAASVATPGKAYGPGEFDIAWGNIRTAGNSLRDLARSLRSVRTTRASPSPTTK